MPTFAVAISNATRDSTDPKLRTDAKQAADQLPAKAADATAVFSKIKSPEDVNTAVGATLQGWLEQHCT